jgi:hypothetical protein
MRKYRIQQMMSFIPNSNNPKWWHVRLKNGTPPPTEPT